MSDLIQWLSELNVSTNVRIYINEEILFAGTIYEFINQTSDYAINAISKILLIDGNFEKPYIDDNDLVVNIVTI